MYFYFTYFVYCFVFDLDDKETSKYNGCLRKGFLSAFGECMRHVVRNLLYLHRMAFMLQGVGKNA
jgi:hypothetical protein